MRLIQADIRGYKHLKDVTVRFTPPEEGGLFQGGIPIRFFIGANGAGKSAFLEGLCFLFSRLVQDEVPGFDFFLCYDIRRAGKLHRVEVSPGRGRDKFEIRVFTEGRQGHETLNSFEDRRGLLPDYVFTCASGNNNNFYAIMMQSPKDSLYSDLFDASLLGKSTGDPVSRGRDAEKALSALRRLEENPLCLFIDEQTSILALCAFLAVLPCEGGREPGPYLRARERILSMLDSAPQPRSFSLVLDAGRLAELGEAVDEYGGVFSQRIRGRGDCWETVRLYQGETEEARGDRVLTFLFAPWRGEPGEGLYVKSLTEAYGDPLKFLSKLVLARNQGLIKEAHLGLRLRGAGDILAENALSEGEYMLLVRLGLLAMGGHADDTCQCLYLLDEPDVYLNERWNIEFISLLHQICGAAGSRHEIIVATHSSLILTDAFPEQLYYFHLEGGQVRCHTVRASTFGGNRNEIMQALFQTGHPVGSFAYSRVEQLLERAQNWRELERCLEDVGSGYLRLRLLNRIRQLKEREEG